MRVYVVARSCVSSAPSSFLPSRGLHTKLSGGCNNLSKGIKKSKTHRARERAPTGINGWDKRIIEKYTFHSRCCRVCAKTVGESCGGPGGFSGTCEPPLQCVQRLQMKGSGVCLGGYTINYRISSLNIHVQSTCIEGGCLDCWLDYCCCCSSSSSTVRISMPCSV